MEADQNRFDKEDRPFETPETEEPRKKTRRKRSRKHHSSIKPPIAESASVDKTEKNKTAQSNNIADEVAKVLDRVKRPSIITEAPSEVLPEGQAEEPKLETERTLDYGPEDEGTPEFSIIEGEIYIRSLEDDNQGGAINNDPNSSAPPTEYHSAPNTLNTFEPANTPDSLDANSRPGMNEVAANVSTPDNLEMPKDLWDLDANIPNYDSEAPTGLIGNTGPNYNSTPPVASQKDHQPHLHQNRPSTPPLRPFGSNLSSLNPDTRRLEHLQDKVDVQGRQIKELEQARTDNENEADLLQDQNDGLREKISRLSSPTPFPEFAKPIEAPVPQEPAAPELPPIEPLDRPASPDHHFEQSAWHTIEVDSKTGRAAEQPSFNYGPEFTHEQHQETIGSEGEEVVAASGQLAVGTEADVRASQSSSPPSPVYQDTSLINQINPFKNTSQMHLKTDLWLWIILLIVIIADISVILS